MMMNRVLKTAIKLCLIISVIYPAVNAYAETGKTFEVPAKRDEVEEVFFFQAEDGIRDLIVTGVQTCALPISVSCSNQ